MPRAIQLHCTMLESPCKKETCPVDEVCLADSGIHSLDRPSTQRCRCLTSSLEKLKRSSPCFQRTDCQFNCCEEKGLCGGHLQIAHCCPKGYSCSGKEVKTGDPCCVKTDSFDSPVSDFVMKTASLRSLSMSSVSTQECCPQGIGGDEKGEPCCLQEGSEECCLDGFGKKETGESCCLTEGSSECCRDGFGKDREGKSCCLSEDAKDCKAQENQSVFWEMFWIIGGVSLCIIIGGFALIWRLRCRFCPCPTRHQSGVQVQQEDPVAAARATAVEEGEADGVGDDHKQKKGDEDQRQNLCDTSTVAHSRACPPTDGRQSRLNGIASAEAQSSSSSSENFSASDPEPLGQTRNHSCEAPNEWATDRSSFVASTPPSRAPSGSARLGAVNLPRGVRTDVGTDAALAGARPDLTEETL
uniref:Uncharacterized protein n=1 Tax=Chromera velia CCMP2878 TaxID=1169474 RepID=A0A0G4GKD9_9ALVE|eukprot:Cvel_4822.t1-p1 / transcript=Cvel_4822.t1 / gene=Cvel_4822 / organism=Chromera_velia_CCMP2878 / gene_product=hypothetical protein / transcript_product=hypothetical protein / location=Cvel_scaffold217:57779-59017(-) / protein_length=413 / sequence_SO=supercontig / SO=protein_coding / is_pseudo=false